MSPRLSESFRAQARACGSLGSAMYADLLARAADDLDQDGPTREVLRGYEDSAGPSALALRLAGSVHRLVLERRAGVLATYYPSVGGSWDAESGWEAFRDLLAAEPEAVREWLDRPPQTNEVGRSAALMAGLLTLTDALGDVPVRLVELGSSGGLNLLADRYRYRTADGRAVGPVDAPVTLSGAWVGDGPWTAPWPRLVERVATDVLPVDLTTTEGRLALTAYVWPDQAARHERLRGALAAVARTPVPVRRAGAREVVDTLELSEGCLTVLWHSVMWQYLDRSEQEAVRAGIDRLGAAATGRAPFAHLFLEPTRRTPESDHEFLVVLESWPAGARRVLATSRGHGLPTTWEGTSRSADSDG
ncbi:MAG: DUF2332 domain-containing protein [Nocardioides sp.]|uniref:DUF2332 domain-containing protein n=1 Tax=Nocardioides sp. TaxID=35761 RepID=UPI00238B8AC1|nr:DUF2332 domain-containing protein [Nocardioides sp.]MDE0776219.1 DUF2332 domain-containing protein [Nocardioides sp.]